MQYKQSDHYTVLPEDDIVSFLRWWVISLIIFNERSVVTTASFVFLPNELF